MRTKLSTTLTDATAIADAIVDASTCLQHLVRMDGTPYTSTEGAIEKARTAAEGGHPTMFFEDPLNAGRYSMRKMPLYPIEGGIPVVVGARCTGAIGVAGALPALDAAIADAGRPKLACTAPASAPAGSPVT